MAFFSSSPMNHCGLNPYTYIKHHPHTHWLCVIIIIIILVVVAVAASSISRHTRVIRWIVVGGGTPF